MTSEKQVFLMGTGRSGTTIVNRLLGLHDQVWSFRHESQIFSGLPPLVEFISQPLNTNRFKSFENKVSGHLYKRGSKDTYYAGLFELITKEELEVLLKELKTSLEKGKSKEDNIRACAKFSDGIFKSNAESSGKSIWIEKTPRNLVYADLIQKLYPNAKFINVVRDGRLVAKSILQKKFWPVARSNRFPETSALGGEINEEKAIHYWVNLMKITDKMRQRVKSENWLDIRLEDLSLNLPAFQERFERFLNIPHDKNFCVNASKMFDPLSANRKLENKRLDLASESLRVWLNHYLETYGYDVGEFS